LGKQNRRKIPRGLAMWAKKDWGKRKKRLLDRPGRSSWKAKPAWFTRVKKGKGCLLPQKLLSGKKKKRVMGGGEQVSG